MQNIYTILTRYAVLVTLLATSSAVDEQKLKEFTLTTRREFHLSVNELNLLFPNVPRDAVEQAFTVFDAKHNGVVDSCELLASLVLAAPQLPRDIKQKTIFEMFNVSTHRVGLMVADEATLLFRTVVVGASKYLWILANPSNPARPTDELPRLAFFEDLTKASYGEQETLTYQAFEQLCKESAEIDAFMVQWTTGGEQQPS